MKLLADTHLTVWASQNKALLSPLAQQYMSDPKNELWFSVISIWEIAIKQALGRQRFTVDAKVLRRLLLEAGYKELPLTGEHAVAIDQLPSIHGDPFDRILIAQAMCEGMTLLTADSVVATYPGPILRV